ncbi:MAG: hypothetical protein M1150_04360 [Patescibacteria group bacterium]|nr:hypothetical protein [Patescibacteria group bacterium]
MREYIILAVVIGATGTGVVYGAPVIGQPVVIVFSALLGPALAMIIDSTVPEFD